MNRIRQLPTEVANRIAAGEVIERPASVVKELIENALDAGAEDLRLDLEAGGLKRIRISDDGSGMSEHDLALCVQPHATSKIADVDDLFRIASFGFRGEALPSIAAVSELTILSRERESPLGARLEVRAGEVEGPMPEGMPPGTVVEARNLFFNVPARRKFLKAARTELTHVLDAVTRLLLPNPHVRLLLAHDGKKVLDLRERGSMRERIGELFGPETAGSLLELSGERGPLRLLAWISAQGRARRTADQQFVFLNGRYIRDRSVSFAIKDAYHGLLMPREQPSAFLFLELPPDRFDVNVHPTKTEVRFLDRDLVVGTVRNLLRQRLSAEDAAPRLVARDGQIARDRPSVLSAPGGMETVLSHLERELFDAGPGADAGAIAAPPGQAGKPASPKGARQRCAAMEPLLRPRALVAETLQIHRSYIVTEDEGGLVILDQHALHERRLYEAWMAQFERGEIEVQRLLVPEPVELGPSQAARLLLAAEDLSRLGIDIQPFGPGAVAVQALPSLLDRLSGEDAVFEVLSLMEEERGLTKEALLHRAAADLACRSAVRFGQELHPSERRDLVEWWRTHPESRNCPHGRPVALRLGLNELEALFERKT